MDVRNNYAKVFEELLALPAGSVVRVSSGAAADYIYSIVAEKYSTGQWLATGDEYEFSLERLLDDASRVEILFNPNLGYPVLSLHESDIPEALPDNATRVLTLHGDEIAEVNIEHNGKFAYVVPSETEEQLHTEMLLAVSKYLYRKNNKPEDRVPSLEQIREAFLVGYEDKEQGKREFNEWLERLNGPRNPSN